jgi:hypothetical protein
MITIPEFVASYLIRNNRLLSKRVLIIAENYQGAHFGDTYFYKSLPTCPGLIMPAVSAFFNQLCNGLNIPNSFLGAPITEFERLTMFLDYGYLLIDALEGGGNGVQVAPAYPIPLLQLERLIDTILLVNPEKIIFLTENVGVNIVPHIIGHPMGPQILPKIVVNPITGTNHFAYPAAPANPNIFINQMIALHANGLII